MELRQGEPSDLSFICRLERHYMTEVERDQLPNWYAGIDRLLEQWVDSLPRMTIAQHQGVRVGYMFWDIEGEKAVLASIAVDPPYRRKGFGFALLRSFEDDARLAGCCVAELNFEILNPAKHLYEKFEYKFMETTGRYVRMTKALRPCGL